MLVIEDDERPAARPSERPAVNELAIAAGLVVLSAGAGALLALLV